MSRWEGFEELVEVVDSGSFSAAARVLGVSKGHVSQQISRLEDRIGTRLLHRTTRKLSLTETGEIYYARCRQVVEDLESAEVAVSQLQAQVKGLLTISAPHLIGESILIPALAKFQVINPELEVNLQLTSRRIDLIEEHIDIAIQVGARKDVNVVNLALKPTRFHVVASTAYLKKYGEPQNPKDLKHHSCLLFVDAGQTRPWRFKGDDIALNVSVNGSLRSNSGHALLAAARNNCGIAYLPDYYLDEDLANGLLLQVLKEWQTIDRDVVAIYQNKRHLSAKVRLFTEYLAEHFRK